MKHQKTGTCIYCGAEGPITDDHIPPKNLFGKPRPSNLLAVPSCERCNNLASLDDEYFKSRIVFRKDVKEHAVIKQIRPSVIRSFEKKKKEGFAEAFLKSLQRVDFPGSPGSTSPTLTYDVDLSRFYRVISRTTQAYHWKEIGQRVPSSCYVGVVGDQQLEGADAEFQELVRQEFSAAPVTTIGNKVFSFQGIHDLGDRRITVWLMAFYERVTFLSATLPFEAEQGVVQIEPPAVERTR